jgi:uncharacterized protein YukE
MGGTYFTSDFISIFGPWSRWDLYTNVIVLVCLCLNKMSSNCAVATCSNYHKKTKLSDVKVIYHRFPKDSEMCKLWLGKCKRKDPVNCKYAYICSEHFKPDDYVDDMKNRLLGLPQKMILKSDAVPSLKIPLEITDEKGDERNVRAEKRRIRQNALLRLEKLSPKKPKLLQPESTCTSHIDPPNSAACDRCESLLEENKNLKESVDTLNKTIKNMKREHDQLYKAMTKKKKSFNRTLKRHAERVKTLNKNLARCKKQLEANSKLSQFVSNFLSPTQMKSLEAKGKVTRWSSEDLSRAVMIRALSRKSYDFWRDKMNFPLPSAATLKRWCVKFSCRPGVLHNVFTLMANCTNNLTELDKYCVLSFDEMHIDSKVVYDSGLDQILGPFSKVQVAMLRGLTSKWKQPVYFDFDQTMSKEILFNIINRAHQAGFKVCAVVSDLGGCGTLWKELNISVNKTYFINPAVSDEYVWVFADMPHYLKLLRNHLIDEGLLLSDGTEVNPDVLNEVLTKDNGEVKLCYKLDPSFLTLKGNERQRVAPAKAVFSRTTAKAIEILTGNKRVASFVELIDSFTDIMNSKSPYPPSSHPMRAPFGPEENYEIQKKILEEVKLEMTGLRVKGKKSMLPFQKGFIISIISLFGLFDDLTKVGLRYIMTCRLTQDVLESFFSQIRGAGVFADHPTASEVISRIRKIMLSNKMPKPSPKVNVEAEGNSRFDVYLTAELIDSAFTQEELNESPVSTNNTMEDDAAHLTDYDEPSNNLDEAEVEKSWAEKEALAYVAGYVAYKVRKVDPSLGKMSRDTAKEDLSNETWIKSLSHGKLTVPSEEWKSVITKFENVFLEYHGEGTAFSKKPNVIKNLKLILSERFPTVCPQAIHVYSRIRTFIRLRAINRNIEDKRGQLKKAKKWIKSNIGKGAAGD